MKFFHTALGVLTFIAMMAIATPAKAEVVFNEWHEFAFPLTDDSGCAGEDGVVSGVFQFTSHLTEINGEFVRWVDNFSTACKGN